ncbi:MAG: flagellar protein FliT [Methylococcaceae bacterium]|nr:flagellar protein FliT [Methylococcaceae bacterium]
MSECQLKELASIKECSEEMLQMAMSEQWDSIESKQEERDNLLTTFFSQELVLESEFIAKNINALLNIDSQIVNLVRNYKNELQSELKKIVHGKNAVKAYSNG